MGGDARSSENLFRFGDKDGKGQEVLLQHPLGVAVSADGRSVFVTDSYNHKLKALSLESGQARGHARAPSPLSLCSPSSRADYSHSFASIHPPPRSQRLPDWAGRASRTARAPPRRSPSQGASPWLRTVRCQ